MSNPEPDRRQIAALLRDLLDTVERGELDVDYFREISEDVGPLSRITTTKVDLVATEPRVSFAMMLFVQRELTQDQRAAEIRNEARAAEARAAERRRP